MLLPAVMLATAATVIASQAVISGAFALVQQAIQLGALPRLDIRQTSDESVGQVYVPQINWLLAAAVLALVFGFRSSDALANAYGIAVAGDMPEMHSLMPLLGMHKWLVVGLLGIGAAGCGGAQTHPDVNPGPAIPGLQMSGLWYSPQFGDMNTPSTAKRQPSPFMAATKRGPTS